MGHTVQPGARVLRRTKLIATNSPPASRGISRQIISTESQLSSAFDGLEVTLFLELPNTIFTANIILQDKTSKKTLLQVVHPSNKTSEDAMKQESKKLEELLSTIYDICSCEQNPTC